MLHFYSSRLALPLLLASLSTAVYGVDGQVLIDQNRALAGNVTPGDTPGFPVSITQPGSYKLSGNLTVADVNAQGIVISANHVTIDLHGFAILGPAICSTTCSVSTAGIGITTAFAGSYVNITIRNGTIQGMGGSGVNLVGSSHVVEYLHVRGNGGNGIIVSSPDVLSNSGVIRHNTVQHNSAGIVLFRGLVSHNTVSSNRGTGISARVAMVAHNFIFFNKGVGLVVTGAEGAYHGNVVNHNLLVNGRAVDGSGVNALQNVCDGVSLACVL